MKLTTKIWKFFKSTKTIIGIIVIIGLILFFTFRNNNSGPEIFTLTSENLATTGITLGGTVVAQEEVDLSFEISGRVSQVAKKAGEVVAQGNVIATLDTGTISANVLKAQADLDAEIAKLNEYKTQEGVGSTEVESKKNQLVREIQNAYIVSEDAVKNKTDQFFKNADDRFPEIYLLFDDYKLRGKINEARYNIGLVLKKWKVQSNMITASTYTSQTITDTKNNVAQIQTYINLVASAVNQFEANQSYPQAAIDKYKSDVSIARANLNSALSDLINADEALRSTSSQIPYQEARVKSARATLQNYQAELEKGVIRAPFNGLITKQDAKVGMSAMGDQTVVSMISDSNYGIDTYVPEIYIAQIKIGNKAKVTLNSYGSTQLFDATVTYIDPAASERDGVASYKVELVFDNNDERIKSGMTADVEIFTEAVNPTFWVPNNTLTDQGGATYVKVKNGELVELRKVEVGERNPTETEILSGLIVGDQLIIEAQK
jgi:HlyD family secretion protein